MTRRATLLVVFTGFFTLAAGVLLAQGKRSVPQPGEVPLFSVKVTGQGQPMILIPGLISSGDVWKSTVAHYAPGYECHVLTLAGFAGQPPSGANPFLPAVRDAIARYIREQKLEKPVIVGHSLGGFLALSVAATNPDLVGKLVIVDALPAPGAEEKPDITVEELTAISQRAAASYAKTDAAARRQMIAMMAKSPEDIARIASWDEASDRATAMRAVAESILGDVRADLAKVDAPALVLMSWAGEGPVDRDSVARTLKPQFKYMKNWRFAVAPTARHFIMYDEPQWMFEEMDRFLAQTTRRPVAGVSTSMLATAIIHSQQSTPNGRIETGTETVELSGDVRLVARSVGHRTYDALRRSL